MSDYIATNQALARGRERWLTPVDGGEPCPECGCESVVGDRWEWACTEPDCDYGGDNLP
jgi:hypothetical protein